MIAPNSRARKWEKKRGEVKTEEGVWKNLRVGGGECVQPSQQLVAPCVKWVEWGLGTRCLRK